jgi:hypothetical protein
LKKHLGPAVLLACLLLVPQACSSDDPAPRSDEIELGGDAESSAEAGSPSEEAEPTRPAAPGEKVDDSVEVTAGDIAVKGADEQQAADALVRYVRVRLEAFNRADVDLPALAEVAIGDALAQVRAYVAELQQRKQHTVGTIRVNVSGVDVKGAGATIQTCMDNTSVDVDRRNRVVETDSPAAYLGTAKARRVADDTWLVSDVSIQFTDRCS